jgi:ATP synthase B/B' CF(0)
MPQFDQILSTYASQIFWTLIVFGLIYFTVGKGMVSKIDANVEARDRKIADDLAAAEKARAQADSLVAGGSDAINEARAEAQAKAAARQWRPRMPKHGLPRPTRKLLPSLQRLKPSSKKPELRL